MNIKLETKLLYFVFMSFFLNRHASLHRVCTTYMCESTSAFVFLHMYSIDIQALCRQHGDCKKDINTSPWRLGHNTKQQIN